jgi:hypothetical protein
MTNVNQTEPRAAYSIPEIMIQTGLGRDCVYKNIRARKLIAKKIGRRTIVLAADLQRFLEALPTLHDGGSSA